MATLTLYCAAEGVTGSCYLLETEQSTILLESGLVQGSREDEARNKDFFPFDINKLDTVVLSMRISTTLDTSPSSSLVAIIALSI